MKSWLKFMIIVAVIVGLSVLLAPFLYKNLPWHFKFERIFNRLIMIGTLIAVVLFVRVRAVNIRRYGLTWEGLQSLSLAVKGFGISLLVLGLLTVVKIVLGLGSWNPAPEPVWIFFQKIVVLTATGFLIGVIEEFFFRGFVYASCRDKFGWGVAVSVIATNLFYSLVHFVGFKKPFIGPDPGIRDSLTLAIVPFTQLMHFPSFWHEFLGLFFFGVLLNYSFLHTRKLYPAIGIHAGCVFFVKMDGLLVDFTNRDPIFYSSAKMYDGFLGWVSLMGMACLFRWIFKKGLSGER